MKVIAYALMLLTLALASPMHAAPATKARRAFLIMVRTPAQERDAALLIDSLRAHDPGAGKAPIYIALADPAAAPGTQLKAKGAKLIQLAKEASLAKFPFVDKVWACAEAEALAEKEAELLVWMNAEALVVAPLSELELAETKTAAVRPVHIKNVGLPVGAAPDAFWAGVYQAAGIRAEQAFPVESFVDGQQIHAYFNTHVFAVRPERGLLRAWKKNFEVLRHDKRYQAKACADESHRVFLHQAVLSAVLLANLRPDEFKELPPTYSYPLQLQHAMPPERRAKTLNSLVLLVHEDTLRDPDWLDKLRAEEPLKSWLLKRIEGEPVPVAQGIYRAEGSSNSYLVETRAGNVLIDAGSMGGPASRLLTANAQPVKTVLLTHGHSDHIVNLAAWRQKGVPVVAQREFVSFKQYEQRLAGFLGARHTAACRAFRERARCAVRGHLYPPARRRSLQRLPHRRRDAGPVGHLDPRAQGLFHWR